MVRNLLRTVSNIAKKSAPAIGGGIRKRRQSFTIPEVVVEELAQGSQKDVLKEIPREASALLSEPPAAASHSKKGARIHVSTEAPKEKKDKSQKQQSDDAPPAVLTFNPATVTTSPKLSKKQKSGDLAVKTTTPAFTFTAPQPVTPAQKETPTKPPVKPSPSSKQNQEKSPEKAAAPESSPASQSKKAKKGKRASVTPADEPQTSPSASSPIAPPTTQESSTNGAKGSTPADSAPIPTVSTVAIATTTSAPVPEAVAPAQTEEEPSKTSKKKKKDKKRQSKEGANAAATPAIAPPAAKPVDIVLVDAEPSPAPAAKPKTNVAKTQQIVLIDSDTSAEASPPSHATSLAPAAGDKKRKSLDHEMETAEQSMGSKKAKADEPQPPAQIATKPRTEDQTAVESPPNVEALPPATTMDVEPEKQSTESETPAQPTLVLTAASSDRMEEEQPAPATTASTTAAPVETSSEPSQNTQAAASTVEKPPAMETSPDTIATAPITTDATSPSAEAQSGEKAVDTDGADPTAEDEEEVDGETQLDLSDVPSDPSRSFQPPPFLEELFASIFNPSSPVPRILIFGAKGVGKSTLARFFIQRFFSGTSKTAPAVQLLELDPGQPTFSAPGTLSLVRFDSADHFDKVHTTFLGEVSPRPNPVLYIREVAELCSVIDPTLPLIINTHSWYKGLGSDLFYDAARLARPNHAVHILKMDGPDSAPVLNPETMRLTSVNTIGAVPAPEIEDGYQLRTHAFYALFPSQNTAVQSKISELNRVRNLTSCFDSSRTRFIPFTSLRAILPSSALPISEENASHPLCFDALVPGSIIGLYSSKTQACVGLGLVRHVCFERQHVVLSTPVQNWFDTLVLGRLRFPIAAENGGLFMAHSATRTGPRPASTTVDVHGFEQRSGPMRKRLNAHQ